MHVSSYHPQGEVDKLALEIYAADGRMVTMEKAYIMARLRLGVKINHHSSKRPI